MQRLSRELARACTCSSGALTAAAAEHQKAWLAKAKSLSEPTAQALSPEDKNRVKRSDGTSMEKMDFDAVYSNKHTHKDTESGIGVGMAPVCDPRRDQFTRPKAKDLGYGKMHLIATAYGLRQPLPTRSIMGIGEGRGRSVDF